MPEWHTLLLFSVAVLGLLVTPGPSMAFLLAHSLAQGPRGGIAVATGILISDLVMSVLTALGLTAAVVAVPGSLEVVRWAGALYLLWLAWQALHRGGVALATAVVEPFWTITRQALVNSLLNPKAFLFFVLFIPQFVDAPAGGVPLQLAVLGTVLGVEALIFHAALGFLSGSTARQLTGERATTILGRLQSVVLFTLAIRLAAS